jgi:hypothetical protein
VLRLEAADPGLPNDSAVEVSSRDVKGFAVDEGAINPLPV